MGARHPEWIFERVFHVDILRDVDERNRNAERCSDQEGGVALHHSAHQLGLLSLRTVTATATSSHLRSRRR